MAEVSVFSMAGAGFSGVVTYDGRALRVKLEGSVDQPVANGYFERLVTRLSSEAKLLRAHEVVFDMLNLEFLDTTGFKGLATWVGSLASGEGGNFKVRFVSSSRMFWQRRSLEMIRRLASGIVSVESS